MRNNQSRNQSLFAKLEDVEKSIEDDAEREQNVIDEIADQLEEEGVKQDDLAELSAIVTQNDGDHMNL